MHNKKITQACHSRASMESVNLGILNLIQLKINQAISLPQNAHFVL